MTQRLALAATFLGSPRLVLLDEPCSALDPAGRVEVLDLIAAHAGGTTVLFSTHVLADVERVCDTVGVLDHGRIVYQGSLTNLLASGHRPAWHLRIRGDRGPVADELRRQPWAESVALVGHDQIRIEATTLEAAETGMARTLADAGARVVALEPDHPDLETVFLNLTSAQETHRTASTTLAVT